MDSNLRKWIKRNENEIEQNRGTLRLAEVNKLVRNGLKWNQNGLVSEKMDKEDQKWLRLESN